MAPELIAAHFEFSVPPCPSNRINRKEHCSAQRGYQGVILKTAVEPETEDSRNEEPF